MSSVFSEIFSCKSVEGNKFWVSLILIKSKVKFIFQGCTIDWKKGKNVTVKVVKKKQKHKSRGAVRTIIKTVQNDSFFNFFSPPPGKILYFTSIVIDYWN